MLDKEAFKSKYAEAVRIMSERNNGALYSYMHYYHKLIAAEIIQCRTQLPIFSGLINQLLFYREKPKMVHDILPHFGAILTELVKFCQKNGYGNPKRPGFTEGHLLPYLDGTVSRLIPRHGLGSTIPAQFDTEWLQERFAECVSQTPAGWDSPVRLKLNKGRGDSLDYTDWEELSHRISKGLQPDHHRAWVRSSTQEVVFFKEQGDYLRGRVATVAVTKYLQDYCRYTQEDIRNYQNRIRTEGKLRFATTRAEIAKVYENGPDSCMAYSIGDYHTDGIRPVEVFAGPDTMVAYLGDINHEVIARCIVNKNDKTYVTVYGDDKIRTALKDKGYTHYSYALVGCRILQLENERGQIICPYIDGDDHNIETHTCSEYHTILDESDGDYSGDYETGLLKKYTDCDDDDW